MSQKGPNLSFYDVSIFNGPCTEEIGLKSVRVLMLSYHSTYLWLILYAVPDGQVCNQTTLARAVQRWTEYCCAYERI